MSFREVIGVLNDITATINAGERLWRTGERAIDTVTGNDGRGNRGQSDLAVIAQEERQLSQAVNLVTQNERQQLARILSGMPREQRSGAQAQFELLVSRLESDLRGAIDSDGDVNRDQYDAAVADFERGFRELQQGIETNSFVASTPSSTLAANSSLLFSNDSTGFTLPTSAAPESPALPTANPASEQLRSPSTSSALPAFDANLSTAPSTGNSEPALRLVAAPMTPSVPEQPTSEALAVSASDVVNPTETSVTALYESIKNSSERTPAFDAFVRTIANQTGYQGDVEALSDSLFTKLTTGDDTRGAYYARIEPRDAPLVLSLLMNGDRGTIDSFLSGGAAAVLRDSSLEATAQAQASLTTLPRLQAYDAIVSELMSPAAVDALTARRTGSDEEEATAVPSLPLAG